MGPELVGFPTRREEPGYHHRFVLGEGQTPFDLDENGALSVGLASQGRVVIADQASFEGTEIVTIGTSGEIDIGVGGLAGIFEAPAIVNDGVIKFNFTDTTTLDCPGFGFRTAYQGRDWRTDLSRQQYLHRGDHGERRRVASWLGTGAFSPASAFTVNTGAVLDLGGFDNAVGSLSGSGVVQNSPQIFSALRWPPDPAPASATLTVGGNNASTTFSGTLQDGSSVLAFNKVGTGTLALTGTNTYTGATRGESRDVMGAGRHDGRIQPRRLHPQSIAPSRSTRGVEHSMLPARTC